MGMRGTMDYYGGNFAPLVDKQIGEAFWIVKEVACNMESIKYVQTNMLAIIALANTTATLGATVTALQATVAAQATQITTLQTAVAALVAAGG